METPPIEFAGCGDILSDGTCVARAKAPPLRVWIGVADHVRVDATVDGRPAKVSRRSVAGGLQLTVDLPAEAASLRLDGADPAWEEAWTLAITHEATGTRAATASLASGQPTIPQQLATLDRAKADAFNRGDYEAAVAKAAELAELARRHGRLRRAAREDNTVAFLSIDKLQDLERAAPHIEALQHAPAQVGEARVWSGVVRGMMARALGDPTAAVQAFGQAADHASRLGLNKELLSAREGLAITYGELGRAEDAAALSREVLTHGRDASLPCALRYAALDSGGWVQLLLGQRGTPALDPQPFFEEALELVGRNGECPRWDAEVNVRINLALAAILRDEPGVALSHLDPVDVVPAAHRSWVDSVTAKAALALNREDLFLPLLGEPRPSLSATERYDHWVVLAQQREALGMTEAAVDGYVEAEAVIDEQLTTIAHDLGRELYITGQQESLRGLVRALLQQGRSADALCRVRHARGRALRLLDRSAGLRSASPESRRAWRSTLSDIAGTRRKLRAEAAEDWERSASEQRRRRAARRPETEEVTRRLDEAFRDLGASASTVDCASPVDAPAGDVMIVVLPLEHQWAVFVAHEGAVVANLVDPLDVAGAATLWAEHAFAGAQAWVDGASRIRVLPIGESWDVDWHALRWREHRLLDVAPVAYALDLARAARVEPERTAVVIADADDDLPLARREAEAVTASLDARGFEVTRLTGGVVTGDRLVEAITAASLLHYAGHGRHAGPTGWDAHLRVAGGEEVGVGEILALTDVPRGVILSGCETGRGSSQTLDGGMSIATAFVLSGSDWVIATDREVPDTLAAALGAALHDGADVAAEPAEALRAAQRELAEEHPQWAAYRVIVR